MGSLVHFNFVDFKTCVLFALRCINLCRDIDLILHDGCRKGRGSSSALPCLTLHPSACNPPRPLFHHPRTPIFSSHNHNNHRSLSRPATHKYPPPGLAVLLVVGCLGDQAELLLRTGASFLTLTSSLLPGEQTFENFPEYL